MLSDAFLNVMAWAKVLRDYFNSNFRRMRSYRTVYTSSEEITPEQRAAMDSAFKAMDAGFLEMNKAFDALDRAFADVRKAGSAAEEPKGDVT